MNASAVSPDSLVVATVNVNGIRAAVKQRSETNLGLNAWLEETPANVVLLQEVRASEEQAAEALAPALDAGWELHTAPAAAKGRAGVAIASRLPLRDIQIGFGNAGDGSGTGADAFADSGRYIEATVEAAFGPVRVASLYLPSGSAGTDKQDEKYRFLDVFTPYLLEQDPDREIIVGGDWNICHRREDLKNWKTNRKKAGFLPDERAFLDHLLGTFPDAATQIGDAEDSGRNGNPAGVAGDFYGAVDYTPGEVARERVAAGAATDPQWFDVVRQLHPDTAGPYSWWTYRGQAFDTDAGWRIDLQVATAAARDRALKANNAWVDRAEAYDQRWSDHAPVVVEYAG